MATTTRVRRVLRAACSSIQLLAHPINILERSSRSLSKRHPSHPHHPHHVRRKSLICGTRMSYCYKNRKSSRRGPTPRSSPGRETEPTPASTRACLSPFGVIVCTYEAKLLACYGPCASRRARRDTLCRRSRTTKRREADREDIAGHVCAYGRHGDATRAQFQ